MAEILIYGDIGWEVTPSGVAEQLAAADGDVVVRINSPGGDVYDGIAIMNALRSHDGVVTAVVEGMAASAASFIAVGGSDRLIARPTAELMIHDAWTFADGNAESLSKAAANLERMSETLAGIYAEKAGGEPGKWRELMRAETWFSAEEALGAGLVDAVEDSRSKPPVEAGQRSRVLAKFKYEGRRAAPDPVLGRQKGESMSALDQLINRFGEEKVASVLERLVNQEVSVTVTAELEYSPAEVVPTGKVVVTPVGDVPTGVVFSAGDVPEGWDVEVAEATGVVTAVAPAGAEPGDEVSIPVVVSGGSEDIELAAVVTVVSADESEPGSDEPSGAPSLESPAGGSVSELVTLDWDTYNHLREAAEWGARAKAEADDKALMAEVEQWVSEGRINPQTRAKAQRLIRVDAEAARSLYGSNPENTIPVREIGHGRDEDVDVNKISGVTNPFAPVRF